jgi:hypothetical protein
MNRPTAPPLLEPDREQLEIFVHALFRHAAGDKVYVAVRSFLEGGVNCLGKAQPVFQEI